MCIVWAVQDVGLTSAGPLCPRWRATCSSHGPSWPWWRTTGLSHSATQGCEYYQPLCLKPRPCLSSICPPMWYCSHKRIVLKHYVSTFCVRCILYTIHFVYDTFCINFVGIWRALNTLPPLLFRNQCCYPMSSYLTLEASDVVVHHTGRLRCRYTPHWTLPMSLQTNTIRWLLLMLWFTPHVRFRNNTQGEGVTPARLVLCKKAKAA